MATLFVASGPVEGKWYHIGKKDVVVGRDEALLVRVVGEGVSRKHLRIGYDQASDRHIATDLGSKNGVFLNGSRINGETPLGEEELIRIGTMLLFFTMADFTDDNHALKFYNQRGERAKATVSLKPDGATRTKRPHSD